MGSIPLVALDSRPPADAPDLLGEYGKLQSIRQQQAMAPLQQQQAQQQVQSGALDIAAKQREAQSSMALMGAFANQDPSDPNYFQNGLKAAQATGQVLPQHLQAAMTAALEIKNKTANLSKTQAETSASVGDNLHAIGTQLMQMPEDQLAQQWPQIKQRILQTQGMDPTQHSVSIPDQYPGKNWLQVNTAMAGMSAAGARAAAAQQQSDTGAQRQAIEAPGQAAQAQSLVLKNAAQQLAASPDQATYQAALGELPMKIAKNFPQQFDKNAVLQVGMAPNEQMEAGQRAQTLQQGSQRLGIEGANLQLNRQKADIGANGQPTEIAQAIATGHIVPERMSYLLSRNPELIDEVMKIDPSFDSSKAQAYSQTYKDFTSGKTSIALNAGGTALNHLKELNDMNTMESHIPGTPDYNAYMNKADTLASELAKFYGDATIPAIASIKKTLTMTLPGNRNAAIQTQAQSIGDKLDSFQQTWNNGAPSQVYQKPMPGISQSAIAARAALDPKFAAQSQQASPQGGNHPGIQVGQPVKLKNGQTITVKVVHPDGSFD